MSEINKIIAEAVQCKAFRKMCEEDPKNALEGGAFNDLHEKESDITLRLSELKQLEHFGWWMWDKDVENGFDTGFFAGSLEDPKSGKPDHQGHYWDSIKLYANKPD